MDNITLAEVAQTCCASSRAKFGGVWSADNIGLLFSLPPHRQNFTKQQNKQEKSKHNSILHVQTYFSVNTSCAGSAGVHWLLLYDQQQQQQQDNCRETGGFFFCVWDPLGQPLERYQLFFNHLIKISEKTEIKKIRDVRLPIQSPHSNTCGLYCLYTAHYLIQKIEQKSVRYCDFDCFILSVPQPLKNLQDIDLVSFCNEHCNTNFLYKIK